MIHCPNCHVQLEKPTPQCPYCSFDLVAGLREAEDRRAARRSRLIAGLVLLVLFATGGWVFLHRASEEAASSALPAPEALPRPAPPPTAEEPAPGVLAARIRALEAELATARAETETLRGHLDAALAALETGDLGNGALRFAAGPDLARVGRDVVVTGAVGNPNDGPAVAHLHVQLVSLGQVLAERSERILVPPGDATPYRFRFPELGLRSELRVRVQIAG